MDKWSHRFDHFSAAGLTSSHAALAGLCNMPQELLYTSASRGLLPGRSGYCTVAATAGMAASTIQQLERLSGYLPLPQQDSSSDRVEAFSHLRLTLQGKTHSVLSRVSSAGTDYTGRISKMIYHLILDAGEQPPAGPAWLVSQRMMDISDERDAVLRNAGVMSAPEAHWIRRPKSVPLDDVAAAPCHCWAAATGDAGWAGVLASHFVLSPMRISYLICAPTVSPISLIAEAMQLMPPSLRWQVSFTTCFKSLPGDLSCACRCLASAPPGHGLIPQRKEHLVLDLNHSLGRAPDSTATTAARDGKLLAVFKTQLNPAAITDRDGNG